jgi:hypothetical protein
VFILTACACLQWGLREAVETLALGLGFVHNYFW